MRTHPHPPGHDRNRWRDTRAVAPDNPAQFRCRDADPVNANPLDSPVWSALATTHAHFALGDATIRRYPRDIGPFIAVAPELDTTPGAMGALVAPDEKVYFVGHLPKLDARWVVDHEERILQMAHAGVAPATRDDDIVELGSAHLDAMLELTALVYPSYFRRRTADLGRYYGFLDGGRVAAMAGERMAMTGHREISAVCTHPDFLGRGLARRLLRHLVASIRARGEAPFLHVSSDNTRAIAVYDATDFAVRRELPLRRIRHADRS
jgi:ribosomal protein S18 acetylase RimI-like enzyme